LCEADLNGGTTAGVIAVPIGDGVARWACLFTAAVNTATATYVLRVAGIAWVFAATCDEYNEPNRENSVQKLKEETFHKFSKRFNAQCAQKVKGREALLANWQACSVIAIRAYGSRASLVSCHSAESLGIAYCFRSESGDAERVKRIRARGDHNGDN
jgi:hypothetical protein